MTQMLGSRGWMLKLATAGEAEAFGSCFVGFELHTLICGLIAFLLVA